MFQDANQTSPYFASNATFIEELYERYLTSPSSVDASWQEYFRSIASGSNATPVPGASWAGVKRQVIGAVDPEVAAEEAAKKAKSGGKGSKGAAATPEQLQAYAHDAIRAMMMVRAYRVRGHLLADLDPLGLEEKGVHPELDPASYGFQPSDMDKEIFLDGLLGLEKATLKEILSILRETYCGTVGVEFMHIMHPEQKSWIQNRIEGTRGRFNYSKQEKHAILDTLVEVEAFEQFLTVKYPGTKRFSIQGGDAALPGLQAIMRTSAKLGVKEMIFGMPHRGRMNVLTTILGMPYTELLSIFHGTINFPEWVSSSGDVKYHLGASTDREIEGQKVHLSLLSNPSHLEG